MWQAVNLPRPWKRLVAFSIPQADEMWLLSYEGLHQVTLSPSVVVETQELSTLPGSVYDDEGGMLHLGGKSFPLLGLHGGQPILRLGNGEQLVIVPDLDMGLPGLLAWDARGRLVLQLHFSGGWEFLCGTISADGRYLVAGSPGFLLVFRRRRAMALFRQYTARLCRWFFSSPGRYHREVLTAPASHTE